MAANYIESKIIDPTVAPELAVADKVAARHAKRGVTPKYFIQTFGCQQNEADSERLAGLCETMGYVRAETPQEALLILVNTCAVREHAEKRRCPSSVSTSISGMQILLSSSVWADVW